MTNLVIKRIVILVGVLVTVLGIQAITEENLFYKSPTQVDVIEAILFEREQQAQIDQLKDEALEAYYARLLEEEQERLAEIEEMENAYTLGNRDKQQDYQDLFNPNIKHTFIVDFSQAEWNGLINDMETYNDIWGNFRSNNYRKVTVTYQADNEEFVIPDVGIRSKGNVFSRYPPVNGNGDVIPIHYVLKFNETFDTVPGTLEYELLKTREVFDLEKLAFKWNRNGDKTYLSEVYSMQVFRDAGVPAPNMSLTKFVIRIDGVVEMVELYSVQEVIDEEFTRRNFEDHPSGIVGDLYKVIWPGTLEPIYNTSLVGVRDWTRNYRPVYGLESNDDNPNYTQLIDFTKDLDTANLAERRAFIDDSIAVDNLIRAFAVSVLLGNPDDYRGNANNYYIYFDLDGVFHYIPYDFDHSMGQGWDGSPVFINYSLGNDIYIWEGDGFGPNTRNIPLIDNILLDYLAFQLLYEQYLELFINDEIFSFDGFSELFDISEALYGDEFYMENDKEYYIDTKIQNVLDDIAYYRNNR
jgi:spore coat protein CotH